MTPPNHIPTPANVRLIIEPAVDPDIEARARALVSLLARQSPTDRDVHREAPSVTGSALPEAPLEAEQ